MITSVLADCFKNTWFWHDFERGQIFYGLSKNLLNLHMDRSLGLTFNSSWIHTFFTQLTVDNIGNATLQCRSLHSKTQILLALKTRSFYSGKRVLGILTVRKFIPISSMCKEQTSIPHSSTESICEIVWILDYEWMDYLHSILETC